jgi:hypothetical protein
MLISTDKSIGETLIGEMKNCAMIFTRIRIRASNGNVRGFFIARKYGSAYR